MALRKEKTENLKIMEDQRKVLEEQAFKIDHMDEIIKEREAAATELVVEEVVSPLDPSEEGSADRVMSRC